MHVQRFIPHSTQVNVALFCFLILKNPFHKNKPKFLLWLQVSLHNNSLVTIAWQQLTLIWGQGLALLLSMINLCWHSSNYRCQNLSALHAPYPYFHTIDFLCIQYTYNPCMDVWSVWQRLSCFIPAPITNWLGGVMLTLSGQRLHELQLLNVIYQVASMCEC